jgi:flagellar hook-associated protein 1 FlgK
VELRDGLLLTFQRQLDEVASALVRNFAEADQDTPPTLPDAAGLFTDLSGGAVPPSGASAPGLALRLGVNSLARTSSGAQLIRDGGFGGTSFVYNTGGEAGFQDRIAALVDSFDATTTFASDSGLGGDTTLANFAVQSAAWFESARQRSADNAESSAVLRLRAAEALVHTTGVNVDQEMAALLDLEKSYQASSKIIAIIDEMLSTLLQTVN